MLYKELWNGTLDNGANIQIPSRTSGNYVTITLADNISNYRKIILLRDAYVYHEMISSNTDEIPNRFNDSQLFAWNSSDWSTECINGFGLHLKILSNNRIQVGGNFLYQIFNDGSTHLTKDYSGNYLTNIIGVKRPYERILPFLKQEVNMSVKQAYIKDENEEIISPIVSIKSIYDGGGQ